MAPSARIARTGLPRTRSFRPSSARGIWVMAAAIGIVLNGGLVIALSQVSHLHHDTPPPPPLTVRRFDQLKPEPPAPTPPPRPQERTTDASDLVATVALPALALPSTPSAASDLALPAIGALEPVFELPLLVPAFAAIGAPAEGLPAIAAGPSGPPAFDTPAQRQGALDLDRHYPRAARTRGITGTSRIRVSIDARGRVERVEVLESTPPGVFDSAAERVGREQRYASPAMAGGKPVASLQDITIQWTIR